MNSRPQSNARLVWIGGINNRDTAKSIPQMEREAAKARLQTQTKNPQAATA